mmetsp:Transcript_28525/g.80475  ORF Transcript_28525/g.80475 Transcript_28525/m.80475 type:complete len:291 (-) Transcript_28525:543-1415(-)
MQDLLGFTDSTYECNVHTPLRQRRSEGPVPPKGVVLKDDKTALAAAVERVHPPKDLRDDCVHLLQAIGAYWRIPHPDVCLLHLLWGDHPCTVTHEVRGLLVVLFQVSKGCVHEDPHNLITIHVQVWMDGCLVVCVHNDELLLWEPRLQIILELVLRCNDNICQRNLPLLFLGQVFNHNVVVPSDLLQVRLHSPQDGGVRHPIVAIQVPAKRVLRAQPVRPQGRKLRAGWLGRFPRREPGVLIKVFGALALHLKVVELCDAAGPQDQHHPQPRLPFPLLRRPLMHPKGRLP